jgi:NIMA (never in mitosis gene a)-related kinase
VFRIADSEKFDLQLKYKNATLNSSNIPANESTCILLNNTIVCVLAIIAYEILKAAYGYIRLRFFINPAVDRVDLETLDEIDDKKKSKCEKLWGLEQSKHKSGSDATEIIAGKYRKLEKLGSGAFGSVFLVENLQDGKRFALKEAEESVWSKNDLMEIQIMSKMYLTINVVRLYEAIVMLGSKLFLVMECAAGGDLAQRIEKQKRLGAYFDEAQVLKWFKQCCLGIKSMLSANIIHRDLKSGNVFLNGAGNVLIGDFGLSCELDSAKGLTLAKLGITVYLSPERINKQEYGHTADIWALGVILYEMMALRHPFFMQRDDDKAIRMRIAAGKYAPIPKQYSREIQELLG